jgi:hypothetical protein
VILLDLQVLPGGACDVDQASAFQAVEVRTPILSDTVQELRANPIQLRVVQLDAAGNPPTSVMWRALPVHPKMAVLFFRSVVAQEALLQAFSMYQGLPLMNREQMAPLLTFLLGAVMEDTADPRLTSNQSGWRHKDLGETETFRAWYYKLLAHRAPIHASPPLVDAGESSRPLPWPPCYVGR